MTRISFPNSSSYQGNRPYADVVLNPAAPGGSVTHKCLVDTGADYLQLPASAARASSLSLATAIPVAVSTVAGTATMQMLKSVQVDIEGYLVTVDVLFDSSGAKTLIAGRQVLLAAFSLGFRPTDWLWT